MVAVSGDCGAGAANRGTQTDRLSSMDERGLNEVRLELLAALEANDPAAVDAAIEHIARVRESTLFAELGRTTRQLHEALVGLRLVPEQPGMTGSGSPAARFPLEQLLNRTGEAAHRTLDAVEVSLPMVSALAAQAGELSNGWRRFQRSELGAEDIRSLARAMDRFFSNVDHDTRLLNQKLSEILVAQDVQDFTGQVIRRAMEQVRDAQARLVALMRARAAADVPTVEADVDAPRGEPQVGPVAAANAEQSHDDIDRLLSSLGF